jgi:hypothetical protein
MNMSTPFFEQTKRIDGLIDGGPSSSQYDRELFDLLGDDALNEYFFTRISDPGWLDPLNKAGKFRQIPEPKEYVSETGTRISFLFWPPGVYLKKIAPLVPLEVCRVVGQLPETQNLRVHDVVIELALIVPSEYVGDLLHKVIEGVRCPYHGTLPLKVGELIGRLAKAGQTESALKLAGIALELLEDPKSRHSEEIEPLLGNLREPMARFDQWHYERILEQSMPDLVEVAGDRTIQLLCNVLDRAILLSDRRGERCRPADFSHIWRPAIEEHQQNLNTSIRHLLVSAIRDASQHYAQRNLGLVPAIVQSLEARSESWWVFRRLSLHLLRLFPDQAVNLVRANLVDRQLFDSIEVKHEYFLLEKDCFGLLTKEQQTTVLSWIDLGPTYTDEQLKRWEEFTGTRWTATDKAGYIRQWKRDHLAPIEKYLDKQWKRAYEELLSEEGNPSHPEFSTYSQRGSWGPQSPKPAEDLASLATEDLIRYLMNWKPQTERFMGLSPEGLGRELTAAVSGNPERYAVDAVKFKGLAEPTYVRAILDGFHNAVRQKLSFAWDPVLELCVWVAEQTTNIPDRIVTSAGMDPSWTWTRATVCRLLSDGFLSEVNPIAFNLRARLWAAIEPVTIDPVPTIQQEAEYWGNAVEESPRPRRRMAEKIDPFSNAMNSPRGVALQTVMDFALWVRKEFEKLQNKKTLLDQGFEAMPEVRRVLDSHLDTENDATITIRAVYGQRLPWLQQLDADWAKENTRRIFPRDNSALWHAAWDTFIGYTAPYDRVFDWLRDEYSFAVEQISTHHHPWTTQEGPDYALGHHLMSFYWRGKIEIGSDILKDFYRKADAKLRSDSLSFVGRSLRNTTEPIPENINIRLSELWEWRVKEVKGKFVENAEELKGFAWWFTSGKFDDEWSITQLLEALRLAKHIEPDHLVVERLVVLARTMPARSVLALSLMVEGDVEGFGILGWADNAKQIIKTALSSGDPEARRLAIELINILGRRRYFDFGDLLK